MENTRTIGDFGTKRACFQVVTSEPEFTVHRLSDADHHIILACDGTFISSLYSCSTWYPCS
jgi:serine/threonine protein phosphatase PrpC